MTALARTRVQGLNVSLDGIAAGTEVTLDAPIGGAGRLFSRFDGRAIHGVHLTGERYSFDTALTSTWSQGIGAEIMGRRKFGPQTGPWPDDGWKGWWEDDPPFHTPVFVMTHHPHPDLVFENGTSFHFMDGTPAEVLAAATEAAGGLDVRLGGGPDTIRQFLAADLVDFMHLVTVPIVLGRGTPLWAGLDDIDQRFDIELAASPGGQVHQYWHRRT